MRTFCAPASPPSIRGSQKGARSIGFGRWQTLRYVVIPQAVRNTAPPIGNNMIALLKESSLVSVIGIAELVHAAQLAISETFRPFEFYITAAALYYILNLVLEAGLRQVEKKVEVLSMSTRNPMVEVKDARKAYGSFEVLKGIDLSVERGQIVAIIGPQRLRQRGTLLRSINHLETLNGGEVWLDGVQVNQPLTGRAFERHINAVRQQMGMVFQHFNLFPHLTVHDNIAMGPIILKGMSKAAARELTLELLSKVGLADKIDAYPSRLSGGQKQRVAIARALGHAAQGDAVR